MILLYIFNPITLLVLYVLWAYSSGFAKTALTYVGGLIDVVVNATYGTLVFLELPQEWTLTKRTERLKADRNWRGALAWKLCDLLNFISPNHCNGQ